MTFSIIYAVVVLLVYAVLLIAAVLGDRKPLT
jgi:hypothetical protein